MLKTGTVPVHDQVQRLPTAATGECEFAPFYPSTFSPTRTYPLIAVLGVCERGVTLLLEADLMIQQYGVAHLRSRKTTRRRNFASYKRRWPCDYGVVVLIWPDLSLGLPSKDDACVRHRTRFHLKYSTVGGVWAQMGAPALVFMISLLLAMSCFFIFIQ